MRQFLSPTFISLSVLLVFHSAMAGPAPSRAAGGGNTYIDLTFFPVFSNTNQTNNYPPDATIAADKEFGYDLRGQFGYVFSNNFFFGLGYNFYQVKGSRDATSSDSGVDRTISKTELGPTIGYVSSGWRFLLTYYMAGEKKTDQKYADTSGTVSEDSSLKLTKISGYQLLIGYGFQVSGSFELGPSLVYRSVTYGHAEATDAADPSNTSKNYDADLTTNRLEDSINPMVSLIFRF
jgi:hypothetical protein